MVPDPQAMSRTLHSSSIPARSSSLLRKIFSRVVNATAGAQNRVNHLTGFTRAEESECACELSVAKVTFPILFFHPPSLARLALHILQPRHLHQR